VRNVDQPRNANARGDFGDTPSTVDVYIVKGEVSFNGGGRHARVGDCCGSGKKRMDILCLVITSDEIVHDVRVPDTLCDLFLVADVPFLPIK
jgi:hypothetical protein